MTVERRDRYVRLPIAVRREHRDWSGGEHAAWVDLLLAAYEVRGRFESIDLVRAYLGPRAAALDALIERAELVEEDGEWIMPAYFDLYGEDGKLQRKSGELRLQDAADKMARGERLTDAEYAARHRARRDGIPFPLPRSSDVRPDESNDVATTTTTKTITKTTTNDEADGERRLVVALSDEELVVAGYGNLYGKRPTPGSSKDIWLRALARTYGPKRTLLALTSEHAKDPSPRTICGRMEKGLQAGNRKVPAA